MTRASKQWATTGFIIGVGAGIAIVVIAFIFLRGTPQATAAPVTASAAVAAAPVAAPAASGKPLIAGTISLDPTAAAKVSGPSIVFVIVRGSGAKGHPVLAKRLDIASFPASFALTADDSMMGGGAPPAQVALEVRIDRDGDAMTREPGAPSAVLQNVAMGSTGVAVTLR
jgi:hypothetical protein